MFENPKTILAAVGISPGATVVDLGCGSGSYAFAAATLVSAGGENGKVYAVDVQKDLLDRLKKEAQHHHHTNIELVWANFEKIRGTKLPDHIADVAIVANVLFQVEDHDTFLKEIVRITKPRARVLCVDWIKSPFVAVPGHMPFTKAGTEKLFERHGFVVETEVSAGSHHYGLILRKK